jgi:hypothetical protein
VNYTQVNLDWVNPFWKVTMTINYPTIGAAR